MRQLDDRPAEPDGWPVPSDEVMRGLEAGPQWVDLDAEELAA